jgi:hypothetical protein
MCFDAAANDIAKGSARSPTARAHSASLPNISRRAPCASAWNTRSMSRISSTIWSRISARDPLSTRWLKVEGGTTFTSATQRPPRPPAQVLPCLAHEHLGRPHWGNPLARKAGSSPEVTWSGRESFHFLGNGTPFASLARSSKTRARSRPRGWSRKAVSFHPYNRDIRYVALVDLGYARVSTGKQDLDRRLAYVPVPLLPEGRSARVAGRGWLRRG